MPDLGIDPILVQIISGLEARITDIDKKLESLASIEQHLVIIGRQLDGIAALQVRSFGATLNPDAVKVAEKKAKEENDAFEADLAHEIAERAARGVPNDGNAVTEEDIKQWEAERVS